MLGLLLYRNLGACMSSIGMVLRSLRTPRQVTCIDIDVEEDDTYLRQISGLAFSSRIRQDCRQTCSANANANVLYIQVRLHLD